MSTNAELKENQDTLFDLVGDKVSWRVFKAVCGIVVLLTVAVSTALLANGCTAARNAMAMEAHKAVHAIEYRTLVAQNCEMKADLKAMRVDLKALRQMIYSLKSTGIFVAPEIPRACYPDDSSDLAEN